MIKHGAHDAAPDIEIEIELPGGMGSGGSFCGGGNLICGRNIYRHVARQSCDNKYT